MIRQQENRVNPGGGLTRSGGLRDEKTRPLLPSDSGSGLLTRRPLRVAGQAGWKPPLPSQAAGFVLQLSWIVLNGGASRVTVSSPIFRPGSMSVRIFDR